MKMYIHSHKASGINLYYHILLAECIWTWKLINDQNNTDITQNWPPKYISCLKIKIWEWLLALKLVWLLSKQNLSRLLICNWCVPKHLPWASYSSFNCHEVSLIHYCVPILICSDATEEIHQLFSSILVIL